MFTLAIFTVLESWLGARAAREIVAKLLGWRNNTHVSTRLLPRKRNGIKKNTIDLPRCYASV